MSLKITVLPAIAFALMAALASPTFADTTTTTTTTREIVVDKEPPALRAEAVPAPRTGFVWAPGYWAWENGDYVWQAGRWLEVQSPQARWVPDTWAKTAEGTWRFTPGHFES